MKPRITWLPASLLLATFAASATASQPADTARAAAPPSALSEQDVEFARKAAQGGQMEVMLGKVAVQKAADPEVQRFAERMVQEHQKAGRKLRSIADKLAVPLPSQPDEQARALRDALANLSGPLFDKEYMWNMVAAHTVAIHVFERQIDEGENPMLVKFAEKAVETLADHRASAVGLWEKVK